MAEWLSQKELAGRLGLSTRQINNLATEGLPKRSRKGKVEYEWPAASVWYLERKIAEAVAKVTPEDAEDSRARLETARARLVELELAEREKLMVSAAYMEQQVSAIADRLRAALLAIPAKYAPMMVGRQSIPEAQMKLEVLVSETLAAMSQFGEDEALDADDDRPSETSVAA